MILRQGYLRKRGASPAFLVSVLLMGPTQIFHVYVSF